MKIKLFILISMISTYSVADYGIETITPDWAKIQNEREREAIIRAIGERWWAVVPYV